jgi:hypothetical protein
MNNEMSDEVCGCPMEPPPTDLPIPDTGISTEVASLSSSGSMPDVAEEDAPAWRNELAAKLNRYRARRKAPPVLSSRQVEPPFQIRMCSSRSRTMRLLSTEVTPSP